MTEQFQGPRPSTRPSPLVLVVSADPRTAAALATRLAASGGRVATAESAQACLRVAAAIRPDVILLDPELPRQLEAHLRAYPPSAHARIFRLHPG